MIDSSQAADIRSRSTPLRDSYGRVVQVFYSDGEPTVTVEEIEALRLYDEKDVTEKDIAELSGPELDKAVAVALGWVCVERTNTGRVDQEDGWGRSTASVPPVYETTRRMEWFRQPPRDDASGGEAGSPSVPKFSSEWFLGGPIIEEHKIGTWHWTGHDGEYWCARKGGMKVGIDCPQTGPTLLIAAMRAFVFSKIPREPEPIKDSELY